ncbi:MAG: hypothetical protein K6F52_05745, partial [Clostridia bacterium]|nr:hypothetical protein [Clostridia bacterium]
MRKLSKQFAGWLLTLVMVLTMVPLVGTPVYADAPTGYESYTEWTNGNSLPTEAGDYYLTQDVTFSGTWTVPSGAAINLCLNDHVITGAISVERYGTLDLYDCNNTTERRYNIDSDLHRGVIADDGEYSFTGGYITNSNGGGVVAHGNFNMHGGTIFGCNGNGVELINGYGVFGQLNMDGGNIIGNGNGGIRANAGQSAVNISGNSLVKHNYANNGGGIFAQTLTISGGTISENTAESGGGGIFTQGDVNIQNATISGNHSKGTGGNNGGGGVLCTGNLTMTNVTITGNDSTFLGGGVFCTKNLTMTDVTITGNKASSGGGGICEFPGKTVALNGNMQITGNTNTAGTESSNLYFFSNSSATGGITIGSGLDTDASIGVSYNSNVQVVSSAF